MLVCRVGPGPTIAELHAWCQENLGDWGPGSWIVAVDLGRGPLIRTWDPEDHALATMVWA